MPESTSERPLVSFILLAYNQERFIEEAVRGALSQTYEPLEIIVSDDCSTDATFEAIRRAVGRGARGRNVSLRHNPTNLGIVGHVNTLLGLARGEILVLAAGDDASAASRVERIVQSWEESGRRATVIVSDAEIVGEQGRRVGRMARHRTASLDLMLEGRWTCYGALAAYHRSVRDRFGKIPSDTYFEDAILGCRALLVGGYRHLPEPLVRYRVHSASIQKRGPAGFDAYLALRRRRADAWLSALRQWRLDIASAGQLTHRREMTIRKREAAFRFARDMCEESGARRLHALLAAAQSGVDRPTLLRSLVGRTSRSVHRALYELIIRRRQRDPARAFVEWLGDGFRS